jgi:hypothetical protein
MNAKRLKSIAAKGLLVIVLLLLLVSLLAHRVFDPRRIFATPKAIATPMEQYSKRISFLLSGRLAFWKPALLGPISISSRPGSS